MVKAAVPHPHQSPAVTAVPLFVTFGDISPRRGENLSLPGEAFIRKIDFRVLPLCPLCSALFGTAAGFASKFSAICL